MKAIIIGASALLLAQLATAFAEDRCADPFAKLAGTYKCEAGCSYTASICSLPYYAENVRRWRFVGQRGSATGIHVTTGANTITFATVAPWTFTRASTPDCGETIKLEGGTAEVTWRRVDSNSRACGAPARR